MCWYCVRIIISENLIPTKESQKSHRRVILVTPYVGDVSVAGNHTEKWLIEKEKL